MTTQETQEESVLKEKILRLKKEKNAIIIAHNYQNDNIQDIADFTGDSLELSRKVVNLNEKIIVFCGVRFMAETAKLLSMDKTVLLPRADAGCFMADMIEKEDVIALKKQYPNCKVITYVNSTAEVKALTDVCCTSANALKITESVEGDEVIFIPDRNLASYVQRFTKKKLHVWDGFCNVHARIMPKDIENARIEHPKALALVHPECRSDVVDLADKVLSTSGMLQFVKESNCNEFIIATEAGIMHRMKKENPDKHFYPAGGMKICFNMKKTTLQDLYDSLNEEKFVIEIDKDIAERARMPLDEMIRRS